MVRNELPFENIVLTNNKDYANTLFGATFIIHYTMMCLKTSLLEVDILFGAITFAYIAAEFRKVVCKTVTSSNTTQTLVNIPDTISLYRRIFRVIKSYNEVHGILLFAFIVDLLVFSSLSATNLSTLVTVPYNGGVICLIIAIYFLASFAAINVRLVFNFS